jgi:two-component system, sensor histidine kinase and response regulator
MDVTADGEALRRLQRVGGPTLVRQMIRLFLENLPIRVDTAFAGLRGGNWSDVERAGHSLKSSAAYLGLRDLSERAARLEQLAAQGGGLEVEPLLLDLSASVPALRAHLLQIAQAV